MPEKETKSESSERKKASKINVWMIVSIVLVIALVSVLIFSFGTKPSSSTINSDDIAVKALNFINENLVSPGTNASFVSISDLGDMYNVTVLYQGTDIPVYLTKDGVNMFLSNPLNITKELPKATNQQTQTTETPKTATPTAQLFVMAFCPYGIQAEDAMKPVVDLLGNKANIEVHFIANVGGTTPDTVQSLHGTVEAQEDLRQVCIIKYYDEKTYWNYMMAINANCSSVYNDATSYTTCWQNAANKAGISVTKIDTCSKGSEGVSLLKADDDFASQNGISGSPTLIINGVKYSGSRTPDAFKEAICNAFTTAPSECSQQLSQTGTAATGGCA
jgi:protein-disulfide isomerase